MESLLEMTQKKKLVQIVLVVEQPIYEKYARQIGSFLQVGVKKKKLGYFHEIPVVWLLNSGILAMVYHNPDITG